MGYEWLTGIVGLGGIAGTWLGTQASARTQVRLKEVDVVDSQVRAIREDRKQAYGEVLAAISKLTDRLGPAQRELHYERDSAEDEMVRSAGDAEQYRHIYDQYCQAFEIAFLVASDEVAKELSKFTELAARLGNEAYGSHPDAGAQELAQLRTVLVGTMRMELAGPIVDHLTN